MNVDITCPKILIEEHWKYIESLLRIHKKNNENDIKIIEFHYKTAFAHGWKHAVEEVKRSDNG